MDKGRSSKPQRSTDSAYVLDNAAKEAATRFSALSAALDPGTMRHLQDLGVAPGWSCLEVGGGGGSIATWLAERVGSAGRVLVTDIDPRYLESLRFPNVEVRRHDIVNDPLPEASFDLIHARLVLVHLPQREKVLARLVTALRPGGWILDEEFDSVVVPDPALHPAEVLSKTHNAMIRIMADRGVERGFGRRLFGLLRAYGLTNIGAEGRTFMWSSGSPGPCLMRSNYEQLRGAMIDAGYVTREEFDQDVAGLDNPNFLMPSPLLWAAWGRRP
jgi:ubiquinone/menaquinone biosynthesis C-methylase UbiE